MGRGASKIGGGGGGSGSRNASIKTTSLAELKGTEKQIKYANDIRNAFVAKLQNELSKIVDYPEKLKMSEVFNSEVVDKDPFIMSVKILNERAWRETHSETYVDSRIFSKDLRQPFKTNLEREEFKKLSPKQKIKIYNDGYKKAREKAADQANKILSNIGNSSFWIDNYKSILYK